MRAFEFLTEAQAPAAKKVGREFDHLEDKVFTDPINGALEAVDILDSLSSGADDVALKWDGNPTVYFGRDADGTFRLVGKNNWGREEGKSSSAEELKNFILSRGKGEDWRPKFAQDMANMWTIFEKAVPDSYVGYLYGDLLYHPGKPFTEKDGQIQFTPNQTSYMVNPNSEVGRDIERSKVGVAVHSQYLNFGDKTGEPISDIDDFKGNPDLMVFGQTYVAKRPAVGAENIEDIRQTAKQYQASIAKLLSPRPGLMDINDIIYRFVNAQSRAKKLDQLDPKSFFDWLGTSTVSQSKQKKIAELSQEYEGVLAQAFYLVREIMKAKDEIIKELDATEGDIKQMTKGQAGGEGYVKVGSKVKLVPRDRWQPFRSE